MTSSPFSDLARPPLSEARLRRALLVPGGLWTSLRVVERTGSTNADLVAAVTSGTANHGAGAAAEGAVLIAERQDAGRGRLGRVWRSPARAGIAVSVLLRPMESAPGRPSVPAGQYGWLPLLAGVAAVRAVRRVAGVDAALKWPNDVLIGERKCAGILAEAVPAAARPAAVVGIGLNVSHSDVELPTPLATSLALAGTEDPDRDPLLRALLRELADWYLRWRAALGDPDACGLRRAYQGHCVTLGAAVRVALPADGALVGVAERIDSSGRLVVRDAEGKATALSAGDVVHLRPAGGLGSGDGPSPPVAVNR